MFSFFSSFFAFCSNRLHGTNAWWTSDDAGYDAASDANDVFVSESDAFDDAAPFSVIKSTHPHDSTTVAIRSTRNYKPNEFSPLINCFRVPTV